MSNYPVPTCEFPSPVHAPGGSWGHDISEVPEGTSAIASAGQDDRKAVDPAALASLTLSIPFSALAVLHLADRIANATAPTN